VEEEEDEEAAAGGAHVKKRVSAAAGGLAMDRVTGCVLHLRQSGRAGDQGCSRLAGLQVGTVCAAVCLQTHAWEGTADLSMAISAGGGCVLPLHPCLLFVSLQTHAPHDL